MGNFSAIPRRRLSSLVVVAEIWNHYAAADFPFAAAILHDPYPSVTAALRQLEHEFRVAGDARIECDLGLQRCGRRPAAGDVDYPGLFDSRLE